MEKERIESINGLRGISCLAIMIFHNNLFFLDKGLSFMQYGYVFVEVFVVISGFTMAYNYKDRIMNSDLDFVSYFSKRYFKLMPLYLLTDFCAFMLQLIKMMFMGSGHLGEVSLSQMLLEFSGFYSGWIDGVGAPLNSPLWTACCLLLCYCGYYILCKFSKTQNNYIIASGIVLLLFINRLVGVSSHRNRCVVAFMVGVFLYELYKTIDNKCGMIIAGVSLGGLILTVVLYSGVKIPLAFNEMYIYVWASVYLGPFLLLVALYCKPIKSMLSTVPFVWLGKISMSVYMWHAVVQTVMINKYTEEIKGGLLFFIAYIIVCLMVASVSHYFVEPMMKRVKFCVRRDG